MKLRNKKTGEIKAFDEVMREAYKWNNYNSLAELNAEWEDVPEEPKEDGLDNIITLVEAYSSNDSERYPKEIVEKLKAWKRLKDKGFRFIEGWLDYNDDFIIKAELGHVGLIDQPDVHLLFGGEE